MVVNCVQGSGVPKWGSFYGMRKLLFRLRATAPGTPQAAAVQVPQPRKQGRSVQLIATPLAMNTSQVQRDWGSPAAAAKYAESGKKIWPEEANRDALACLCFG
jgi:hypothetical protein